MASAYDVPTLYKARGLAAEAAGVRNLRRSDAGQDGARAAGVPGERVAVPGARGLERSSGDGVGATSCGRWPVCAWPELRRRLEEAYAGGAQPAHVAGEVRELEASCPA